VDRVLVISKVHSYKEMQGKIKQFVKQLSEKGAASVDECFFKE